MCLIIIKLQIPQKVRMIFLIKLSTKKNKIVVWPLIPIVKVLQLVNIIRIKKMIKTQANSVINLITWKNHMMNNKNYWHIYNINKNQKNKNELW